MENITISGTRPYAHGHGRFDTQPAPYTSPSPADHLEVTKGLLSTLPPPPPYTNSHRWRDAQPTVGDSATGPACQHEQREYDREARVELPSQPYSPLSRPPSADVDDVPLGHFVSTQAFWEEEEDDDDDNASCADEAPPSYAVAVGQSDHDRLLQHFLGGHGGYGEVDEESGVGLYMNADMYLEEDERYAVLKIVAMFAGAIILFGVSGVLGWMVLGGILQ